MKDKIEPKKLNKVLINILDDESWFVRLVAAETLAKTAGRAGKKEINQLKKLLEDKEIIRESVKELLEDFG
jgi:HEAT repeat protein